MSVAQSPLFSVVTPARNALHGLRRCVGSVRGQAGARVEHLIGDACSDDGSRAWLEAQMEAQDGAPDCSRQPSHSALSTADSRYRLRAVSEPDSGMYDAINRGWARSRGPYLSWLNADEQYLPGALERVHRYFEAHPQIDALFADYLVVDAEGRAVALRREIPLRRFYVANTFLNTQSCTLFFRRRLLERGLLTLDARYRYAADKALVLGLLDAGARFAHLPEVLALFGVDGNNLSTHPRMHEEAEAIRLAHGAFRLKPLRLLASAGRRTERLLRGAYRPSDLRYRYALDEVPNYADYHARRVGGRYTLADTTGHAVRLDTAQGIAGK